MIAVDTNILVYAHRTDSAHHEAALRRLRELSEGPARWAIPWPCLYEFLCVVTHPRLYRPPSTPAAAMGAVTATVRSPSVVLLAETAESWDALSRIVAVNGPRGPEVYDARIAAICLTHGVRELWTTDDRFRGVAGLALRNPLS